MENTAAPEARVYTRRKGDGKLVSLSGAKEMTRPCWDRMKAEDDEKDSLKPLMKKKALMKMYFGLFADEVEENFLLLDWMTQIRLGDEHASESRLLKQAEAAKTDVPETMESDYEAYTASTFRDDWMVVWSRKFGCFEDTTKLRPMRFTDKPAPSYGAFPMSALQVFSVRVEGIRRGLQWPLDVFGIIAVRDTVDLNRNIIFSRTRDNCQTLTKEDRNLALVGPSRAVVWQDHLYIEVKLTVKGPTESEDKDLSFLVVPFACGNAAYSYHKYSYRTSKLSTVRLSLGPIVDSVEATIFVRVSDGSWPDGFRAQFAAFTTGIRRKIAPSIDHKKIILLDSGSRKVPFNAGGIELSRRVVSVETTGKLRVCIKAWKIVESAKNAVKDELFFTPQEAGRSSGLLDAGFCKMEVTVAWSLITCD